MAQKDHSGSQNSRQKASELFLKKTGKTPKNEVLLAGIRNRDRLVLGQAITLVESQHLTDRATALQLLDQLPKPNKRAKRLGITGPPGSGKSTFIEAFGGLLVEQGNSLAVLTIDPSSQRHHGSILGDKTRMEQLGRQNNVFIRPSAAGASLGGIHTYTRESITILEAAGFDYILVETVGVGQSEVAVQEMVDCLMLLLTPAGGDELQGIKRGVVEMADLLLVNKSDGELATLAKSTRKAYANALHLFPADASGWIPKVLNISALEKTGLAKLNNLLEDYFEQGQTTGYLERRRAEQAKLWFEQSLDTMIKEFLKTQTEDLKSFQSYEKAIEAGKMIPAVAAHKLFSKWKETL